MPNGFGVYGRKSFYDIKDLFKQFRGTHIVPFKILVAFHISGFIIAMAKNFQQRRTGNQVIVHVIYLHVSVKHL